jgi:hypothetical protein
VDRCNVLLVVLLLLSPIASAREKKLSLSKALVAPALLKRANLGQVALMLVTLVLKTKLNVARANKIKSSVTKIVTLRSSTARSCSMDLQFVFPLSEAKQQTLQH